MIDFRPGWQKLFGTALIGLALLTVFFGYDSARQDRKQNDETQRHAQCIADWANIITERSIRLTDTSARRLTTLDELIKTVALGDPALFRETLDKYIAASNEEMKARAQNPIPAAPQFAC